MTISYIFFALFFCSPPCLVSVPLGIMSDGDQSTQERDKDPVTPDFAIPDTEAGHIDDEVPSGQKTRWADAPFTLESLKADEPSAWKELTKILGKIAGTWLKRSFNNPSDIQPFTIDDAEDMTSNIICKIYEKIATFNNLDHVEAYFRTALKNSTISAKRARKAQSRGGGNVISAADPESFAANDPESSELPKKNIMGSVEAALKAKVDPYTNEGSGDDSDEIVGGIDAILASTAIEQSELKELIFDCAMELSPKERELIGHVYENKSQPEIAEAMKIGEKQITAARNRVYAKLQRKILARLGTKELEDYGIKTV